MRFLPSFMKFYGKFLKKRYGTEEKLRKAWKKEDASFENPIIPEIAGQYFILWKRASWMP